MLFRSKYPNLTREFLFSKGVTQFKLVDSLGATEAYPFTGSSEIITDITSTGETPTAQVQKLSYDELRNRLPKEITDDVIRLIANSNEALQDFAYIRTQGDVVKFNTKYGVNLVLPAQTA